MSRPKTVHKGKPGISKPATDRARVNVNTADQIAIDKGEAVNTLASTLQTYREGQTDEGIVLGTSDFEPAKEAVNAKHKEAEPTGGIELKEVIAPGEAERLRMLAQIQAGFLNKYNTIQNGFVIVEAPELKQEPSTEEKINEDINKVKAGLAAKVKPEPSRMTIQHYKTLKEHERFYTPFKLHGVLYGINERELDLLANTMRQVFEPTYKFDFWCPFCIGEFLTDLYTHFEKWQASQKEQLAEYETLLKEDQF